MQALLASLPVALVILAMAVLRWRAASAGMAGLALAALLAVTAFGLGSGAYPELGAGAALGGAALEGAFIAATIVWIIFPALCIYEMQMRSGAFETIRLGLSRLTDSPRLLALLVAWFFGLFMEGVAGFGTPVALAAPILVGLGFSPVKAVTLALIGHAAGVSFGAVGTPVLPQMAATGLAGTELAFAAALLHALAGWILAAAVFKLAGPGMPAFGEWRWPALAALLFFLPSLALAAAVGPELPTIGGAIAGGALFAFAVHRASGDVSPAGREPIGRQAYRAALPYLVLLVLILLTRLVGPVTEPLRQVAWTWNLGGVFSGRFEPLYHPGTLLMAGFLIGGTLQGRSAADLVQAMSGAGKRLVSVILALTGMLALSRVLVHSGMIDALAEAAAASGPVWPFLAPLVGVLGTFVTGSATSSNILFSEFQEATARTLSLPVATLQGAQNFGAAIGNVIAPHNIIAGAATVALASGREGDVLRSTAVVCVAYALVGGLITAALCAYAG